MPILRVNATRTGLEQHGSAEPWSQAVKRMAPGQGPVIVMVHGFKFAPGSEGDCPHRHILALTPSYDCWKAQSWPRGLGFGQGDASEGLAIAFGWPALGSIWQAHRSAAKAGVELAQLLRRVRAAAPNRPIHAIAHSMGARVVLAALPYLPAGGLTRVLLLGAAEYQSTTATALDCPAGRSMELINITSRENDLYDFLLERVVPRPQSADRTLSAGLPEAALGLTLQLDDPATLSALARHGIHIAGPARRICHWSFYVRPGALGLYSTLLRQPDRLSLAALQATLPKDLAPRWSRLLEPPRLYPKLLERANA